MNTKPTDMNKIDIVQPIPKRACECFSPTCSDCKHEAPHPSLVHSDWSSEDWNGDKAKAKEQKSLFDFKCPKQDQEKKADQQTDIENDSSGRHIFPESDFRTGQSKGGTTISDRFTSPTSNGLGNGFSNSR